MRQIKGNKVFTFSQSEKARFFGRAVKYPKLQAKKVLIFGLGLNEGGVGAARFFAQNGAEVRVTDLKTAEELKPSLEKLKDFDINYNLGQHSREDIDWADLIIKNPAVKANNKFIEYAKNQGKKVEQEIGIFLDFVKPAQIIGVTGTKGKSTTASLIYEVLKASGKNVILAGNIGKSVLDIITMMLNSRFPPLGWKYKKNDPLIILELSSFQLESLDQHQLSPKWAISTNIYPDHLNFHQNMDQYILTKKIIGKYQTADDFLFINKDDPILSSPNFLEGFKGKIIFYSQKDLPQNFKPILKGEHNNSNMAAALAVGKVFGIAPETILETLKNFAKIPFRMELIKKWKGFKIYNDTTATNPDATIQGLKTFKNISKDKKPNVILICGGMNKGMDYTKLASVVDDTAKAVYFLEGDMADEVICKLKDKSLIEGRFQSIEDLLKKLRKDLDTRSFYFKRGDIIFFSPASASFNLFQNEFDRGEKFNQEIEKIFQ